MAVTLINLAHADSSVPPPTIIPQPVSIKPITGTFHIEASTRIAVDNSTRSSGQFLNQYLFTNMALVDKSALAPSTPNIIWLEIGDPKALGREGYQLQVTDQSIHILGGSDAGVFYGVQTLRQLLPPQNGIETERDPLDVPAVEIQDAPRYPWRGYMLDVSRHFFPVDYIKKVLDLMALQKLNTFHIHLTDDQGWRIQINRYPELTSIGAWRDENGQKYGGFYTQDQIREIVKYAADRHITVVPEIEMPGHCMAALATYPELSSTGGPFAVSTAWGIHYDVYCPGKESTFKFLQNVLDEVIPLFPGPFIHIGGDEVPKDRWKTSPECQALMKREHLANEEELQSYFVKRMTAYIQSKGKRLIGWDEILEGGLAPGAAVMSWRGTKGGIAAAASGHDVVMCPGSHCYLDHYQSDSQIPPKPFELLPLQKVYSFNPADGLTADQATHVMGLQGNLWTESVATPERADYMTYPRLAALAEVGWSPLAEKNWPDFQRRLTIFEQRLDELHVNYFRAPPATMPTSKP